MWNFKTGTWDTFASGLFFYNSVYAGDGNQYATVDATVTSSVIQQTTSSRCLRCHGATQPSTVVMPSSVTNIAATWDTGDAVANDFHGAGAGGEPGYYQGQYYGYLKNGLAAGFSRPNAPISCETCHDPHGSSNLYHVPTTVNGVGVSRYFPAWSKRPHSSMAAVSTVNVSGNPSCSLPP